MSIGKISNVFRSLTEEAKGGVLSLTDKVTRKQSWMSETSWTTQSKFELSSEQWRSRKFTIPLIHIWKNLMPEWLESLPWGRLEAMALAVLMPTKGESFGSFKPSSTDLSKTITKVAIRIVTSHLSFFLPYNSCRLIALDKYPGVWPIGIGEVLRQIPGRTTVKCIKTNLKILGGGQQLCIKGRINITCNPFIKSCF